jgi:hypothetical protein
MDTIRLVIVRTLVQERGIRLGITRVLIRAKATATPTAGAAALYLLRNIMRIKPARQASPPPHCPPHSSNSHPARPSSLAQISTCTVTSIWTWHARNLTQGRLIF